MNYALMPGKLKSEGIPIMKWRSCSLHMHRHEGIIPTQSNIHRMPSKWLHKLDAFYLPVLRWMCSNGAISRVILAVVIKTQVNVANIIIKQLIIYSSHQNYKIKSSKCLSKQSPTRDRSMFRGVLTAIDSEWTHVSNQLVSKQNRKIKI